LAFTSDNRALLSGNADSTVLAWDLTPPELKGKPAESPDLERLWSDLADGDAPRAYKAIWAMAAMPDKAIVFLNSRLRPASPEGTALIRQLIGDLDSDRFARREAASAKLAKLGEEAEPVLRAALADNPSQEVKRRLDTLLGGLYERPPRFPPKELQQLRAVALLERIGSSAARQVLETLAKGAPDAALTTEVRAALERLAKRGQSLQQPASGLPHPPANLGKIERKILKEPRYQSTAPTYCLLVFGQQARTRVWLVLDREAKTVFIDRNGNGDLTEENERVTAPAGAFDLGDVTEADGQPSHTDLRLSVTPHSEKERLVWACEISVLIGGKYRQQAGGESLRFAARPQDAPVIHFHGPLSLRPHAVPLLLAGETTEFNALIGTEGLGQGTYAWIAYSHIPADIHPIAEIIFPSSEVNHLAITMQVALEQRC
jgi:hypothetical protein